MKTTSFLLMASATLLLTGTRSTKLPAPEAELAPPESLFALPTTTKGAQQLHDTPRLAETAVSVSSSEATAPAQITMQSIPQNGHVTTMGAGMLSPYPGLPLQPVSRATRYVPPGAFGAGSNSIEAYRISRELQKGGQFNPVVPNTRAVDSALVVPSEPLGAYGRADFVGDNMVSQPQATLQAAGMATIKTTPGISCDSWRSCHECVQFSFCVWNDENLSCRQEIDVLFSKVSPKYFKTCPSPGTLYQREGPGRPRERPAVFPFSSPDAGQFDPGEPEGVRKERLRSGLFRDLAVGQARGLWAMPEEHVDWFRPDAVSQTVRPQLVTQGRYSFPRYRQMAKENQR